MWTCIPNPRGTYTYCTSWVPYMYALTITHRINHDMYTMHSQSLIVSTALNIASSCDIYKQLPIIWSSQLLTVTITAVRTYVIQLNDWITSYMYASINIRHINYSIRVSAASWSGSEHFIRPIHHSQLSPIVVHSSTFRVNELIHHSFNSSNLDRAHKQTFNQSYISQINHSVSWNPISQLKSRSINQMVFIIWYSSWSV
jgi:hypothetical protein